MKKTLCVIPARAGSQRIPKKNLSCIDGVSLVRHAYNAAHLSGVASHIVVSTDNEEMADGLDWVCRPADLSGPSADISQAVHHALLEVERTNSTTFDYVITLQPAIPVRTGAIIKSVLEGVIRHNCRGGLTGVPIVPWIWKERNGAASNSWSPAPYPRSQEFHGTRTWQEVNAVQVAARDIVLEGKRWDLPLLVHLLPSYAALDIDDERDLDRAKLTLSYILAALNLDSGDDQFVVTSINEHFRL